LVKLFVGRGTGDEKCMGSRRRQGGKLVAENERNSEKLHNIA